ncbi:beta-ketoacyl synthase chain length factor [Mixta mediterraneensis]|uniref:beta-ketoacyl synthase chain length factor n=1 Tax=Mixta mediterraneensis TaxID=2758443 RepID=UPI0018751E22|nr:beta-ketoacyl synthase chain length factor [Mixta mediterraneensis]MBE5253055.1 beta-ketoacyl synthase chain length factor [Mixta mediterraneensis]
MKLAYSLIDWQALAPGLAEREAWQRWAQQPAVIDSSQQIAKPQYLPMMTARRLSAGSRAAVDAGLALLARQRVDAVVFTSRHGELARNLRILTTLAEQQTLSPTDFAMSVHNSAVGSLTIAAKQPLVSTSICAGSDTFQQGLLEVSALLQAGYRQVMLVDFDGTVPDYYLPWLPETGWNVPYAVALLLAAGDPLQCTTSAKTEPGLQPTPPQSLVFLHNLLAPRKTFTVVGERLNWHWENAYG